jgi:hypothetical protein
LLTNVNVAYDTKVNAAESGVEVGCNRLLVLRACSKQSVLRTITDSHHRSAQQADEPMSTLAEWLPAGFGWNRELFLAQLDASEAHFSPPGEQVGGFSLETGDYVIQMVGGLLRPAFVGCCCV